jgi:Flp pilus assembly protein TadD
MMFWAWLAAGVAAATPVPPAPAVPVSTIVSEAEHAIHAGRLDQARLMIARIVGMGVKGPPVERLMADLDFASGRDREALTRYQQLLKSAPGDREMSENAGIAALRIGDIAVAGPLIERATAGSGGTWRAWNARGVLADLRRDWKVSDSAYARAAQIFPGQPEVLNNQGWSLLLRGDWRGAVGFFEQAAVASPKSERIANNLELARAALGGDLPGRRAGESDRDWAARLNDAGVAAEAMGNRQRAVAAFTQALEASGSWYARAANNLEATGVRR